MSPALDIYSYTDYRAYLADYYAKRKEAEPWFSYRMFARKAGFSSSGLYPNIVNGLRNLSPHYLPGFIHALGLSVREAEFFRLLVDYTHCPNDTKRQDTFAAMATYLPDRVQRIYHAQRQFYSCWYHVAIHQALGIIKVNKDIHELASFLHPNPGLVQIRKALRLLESLELIQRDRYGYLRPIHSNLMGGEELGSDLIRNFQASLLDLGKSAHEYFPKETRYQITETLGVSAQLASAFRTRIRALHHEFVQQALQEKTAAQVVLQLNIQLFPVSEVHN